MTKLSMAITACCFLATATATKECVADLECPEGTASTNPYGLSDTLNCKPCPECAPNGQYYLGDGVKTAIKENRCGGNWLVIETDENVDLVQSQCMRTPVCPGDTEETATHVNTTYFKGKGNWLVCQPKPTH